jgi:hypothetical protein
MRFYVFGSNRDTGAPMEMAIEADDQALASKIAAAAGMFVSSVRPVQDDPTPTPARPKPLKIPDYPELLVAALVATWIGRMLYLFAFIGVGYGLLASFAGRSPDSPDPGITLLGGLLLAGAASILQCASRSCDALRDIAQNSFKNRA